MAQGQGKLSKVQKSKGAQKRHAIRKKTVTKGRKIFLKAAAAAESAPVAVDVVEGGAVTKSINKKNERLIAAKAISSGAHFFLKDVAEKGNNEMKKQIQQRNKKQSKQRNRSERTLEQLKKLS